MNHVCVGVVDYQGDEASIMKMLAGQSFGAGLTLMDTRNF
jgi:hypothetical protein